MLRGLVLWCVAILVPATVSRAETPSREPVAVAYLSSLDGTLNDVEYIVTAGGRPELATMIRGFVTNLNNLDGIDRTKPIGVYAFVPVDLTSGNKDPESWPSSPSPTWSPAEDSSSEQCALTRRDRQGRPVRVQDPREDLRRAGPQRARVPG